MFRKKIQVPLSIDKEEIRRQIERDDYEKRELDRREYEKRELERRSYERDEYQKREEDRRIYELKLYNKTIEDKKVLLEKEESIKRTFINDLDQIEKTKRDFISSQTQQVTDINSIMSGDNIKLHVDNGKIIISSTNTDMTTLKHGAHIIQGEFIEIESDENIIINTAHPNKIKFSLNIGKLLTRIIELEKKVGG